MYSLYTSIGSAILSIIILNLLGLSILAAILPGLLLAVICFTILNRRFAKQVEALVQRANGELQSAQNFAQRTNGGKQAQLAMEQKTKHAIQILKKGFEFEKWQIGASLNLNAQIGMILFSQNAIQQKGQKNQLEKAIPYLEKTIVKGTRGKLLQGLWHAWLRLAVCYFKVQKDIDKAIEVMEIVVKVAGKEGFAWSVYGWFYHKTNQLEKAVEVLARGVKESEDPLLKENLSALQNGKKPKMTAYGNHWWSLGLEKPKHLNPNAAQQMGHPRMKANRGRRR